MVRVAAAPKDPFKPIPPKQAPVVEVVTDVPADKSSQEKGKDATPQAPSDVPAKSLEIPADELQPGDQPTETPQADESKPADTAEAKPNEDQPAPLMEDKDAKPLKEKEAVEEKSEGDAPQATIVPAKPQELPRSVQVLEPRINAVLDYYYKNQQTDAGKNDIWESMHGFLPYGVDSLIRTPEYRQPVSAIGWICWNKPCRGHRLFEVRGGSLAAKQGPRVQGHHGQFLAMLAQSYVPASFEILVDGQTFTVQDLIEFEKETCVPKSELTFKLIALSHYLPADETWKSRDGQTWSLERLLEEEIQQKVVGAACGGTHRLTGIVFAVKARKKADLPMDGIWARADQYLKDYQRHTFLLQNPDGSFSTEWFERRGADRDLDRRLQTSGHILEFLIYSLPREELTSPKVVQAVNYLTTILEKNPRHQWSIGPKGHALHALVLYDQLVFGAKPGDRSAEILQTSAD